MKTSKIIFITFFGVIGLFLLSLLIQVPQEKRGMKIETETEALPKFSHLEITKGANLIVSYGSSDSIKLAHNKGVIVTKPVYWTKGDTLIVDPIPNQENFFLELTCSGLKSISLTESHMDIKQISLDNLRIEGTKAEIGFYDVTIDSLSMSLSSESRFWCSNSKVKKVNLIADKSNADFSIDPIAELKAELHESSELSAGKVLQSNVTSDETSRYYSR
ncbi:MAG TPA: hypothetical protein PKJ43_03865 [Prolixibacteraceae bacterium]|nr:hypothetical protein [Prolixibacteraceae bacterium]